MIFEREKLDQDTQTDPVEEDFDLDIIFATALSSKSSTVEVIEAKEVHTNFSAAAMDGSEQEEDC